MFLVKEPQLYWFIYFFHPILRFPFLFFFFKFQAATITCLLIQSRNPFAVMTLNWEFFSWHIFLCWMYCRRMPWSVVQWRVQWYLQSLTMAETRLWQMPLQVVPLQLLQSSSTISPEQMVLLFVRNYVICSFCRSFLWICKLVRITTEFQ